MRIALVNDMPLAIEILRRVLALAPEHQVAWVARDGDEAVRMCAQDRPDLILMDLMMPVMDGALATSRIMRETPCAILVVTATVSGNAGKTFEAMGAGALDAISTPTMGADGQLDGAKELLTKIARLGRLIHTRDRAPTSPQMRAVEDLHLVAIGASTGGPVALAQILSGLPADQGLAVVIIQHVDQQFTAGLVEWLQSRCKLRVAIATAGKSPEANVAWVAGTNDHLILGPDRQFRYTCEPADLCYRPSVDIFFSSLTTTWKRRGCAVLLTGMGRDGAEGLLALRRLGWHTIGQDQKSSVVFGMPKAAQELGAATEVLPLNEIAPAIIEWRNLARSS